MAHFIFRKNLGDAYSDDYIQLLQADMVAALKNKLLTAWFIGQIFPSLPTPKTIFGVVVAIPIFVGVTFITYRITGSRWSWVPGVIFGLIAGAVVTL